MFVLVASATSLSLSKRDDGSMEDGWEGEGIITNVSSEPDVPV